jgi:WD40 repeat protein
MKYDAFLSYNHAADDKLALLLRQGLHKFSKPWYKMRALRIFTDRASLAPTAALWSSIKAALNESEHLILLASPNAAASRWVTRELEWWLQHRSIDSLIIVLTEGDVAWDAAAGDFDWSRTSSLSRTLEGKFKDEPLHVDFRWGRYESDLSLRHSRFRQVILDIASPLHGKPKDELDGQDVRQHRQLKAVAWIAGVLLLLLSAVSATTAVRAIRNARLAEERRNLAQEAMSKEATARKRETSARTEAERERNTALQAREAEQEQRLEAERQRNEAQRLYHLSESKRLALEAEQYTVTDPDKALAMAVEAARYADTDELRSLLLELLGPLRTIGPSVGPIQRVAFSLDGGLIMASSNATMIWDVRTGDLLHTLRGGGGTFLPDNSSAATFTAGTLRIWNLQLAARPAMRFWYAPSRTLGFSPNGRLVASGGPDGWVTLRETNTNRSRNLSRTPITRSHAGPINSVTFSADSSRLVSAGDDNNANVWDASTGKLVLELRGHQGRVSQAEFSPDGRTIATVSWDGTARLWDANSGEVVAVLSISDQKRGPILNHVIPRASFSSNGSKLFTVSDDNGVRIWDSGTHQQMAILSGHSRPVTSLCFSKDGRRILTASLDGSARLWDSGTGKLLATYAGHTDSVHQAVFSADETKVATAGADFAVRIWNTHTGALRLTLPGRKAPPSDIRVSPDGSTILTNERNAIRLWEWSGRQLGSIGDGLHEAIDLAIFSPDGSKLLTYGHYVPGKAVRYNHTARLWQTRSGRFIADLEGHTDRIRAAAFSSNEAMIVTVGDDGTARVWDGHTGKALSVLVGHGGPIKAAAFTPDSTHIVTGSQDRTVWVWDARKGQLLTALTGHKDSVAGVSISPDSSRILTTSEDGSARVWDWRSGRQLAEFSYGGERLLRATFSPDGSVIATVARSVRLWDGRTFRQLGNIDFDSGSFGSVEFSPDSRFVLTSGSLEGGRIWDARTGQARYRIPGIHLKAAWSKDGSHVLTVSQDAVLLWPLRLSDLLDMAKQGLSPIWSNDDRKQSRRSLRLDEARDDMRLRERGIGPF